MVFLLDVTVGEGESVPPSTKFTKTWRVQNPGPYIWPPACVLRYLKHGQTFISFFLMIPLFRFCSCFQSVPYFVSILIHGRIGGYRNFARGEQEFCCAQGEAGGTMFSL